LDINHSYIIKEINIKRPNDPLQCNSLSAKTKDTFPTCRSKLNTSNSRNFFPSPKHSKEKSFINNEPLTSLSNTQTKNIKRATETKVWRDFRKSREEDFLKKSPSKSKSKVIIHQLENMKLMPKQVSKLTDVVDEFCISK